MGKRTARKGRGMDRTADKQAGEESAFAKTGQGEVHPELEGFDVRLNSYGEVEMNRSIEEINAFLERASKAAASGNEDQREAE